MENKSMINVYLTFSGNCREAMEFYRETIGGELSLMTVTDAGMADQWPASTHSNIVHAHLQNDNLILLASDMGDPSKEVDGNTVSMSVSCTSAEQHKEFYEGLSRGGTNLMPPHDFAQGRMAALVDKYGKSWMFYYDNTNTR